MKGRLANTGRQAVIFGIFNSGTKAIIPSLIRTLSLLTAWGNNGVGQEIIRANRR